LTTDYGSAYPHNIVCPKCNPPEPTYGPITVEMVAEMLCLADGSTPPASRDGFLWRGYCDEARAVIRLLEWVQYEEQVGPTGFPKKMPADALRTRLLDIARGSK